MPNFILIFFILHVPADVHAVLELGNIPQKNRKEGIFAIPVLKSSEKFYTGKPTYLSQHTGMAYFVYW